MTIDIATPSSAQVEQRARSAGQAAGRGWNGHCPACNARSLYERYLKVSAVCAGCGEALHHHRADDAPPYVTIFVVGHIVVAGVLWLERAYRPDLWIHAILWLPLTLVLSLWLLPRVKGALIGLQWALRMHGFGANEPTADGPPSPSERQH